MHPVNRPWPVTEAEKAIAPHSSTLAWNIPWTEEPGRLQSMRSQSRTQLSDFTFTFHFHALEKETATHSSILAWRIPGTGEPGRLPSMGSQSWTRLKRLSSSSSSSDWRELVHIYLFFQAFSRIILRLPFQWFFRKSHWDSVCSQWWFAGEFTPFIASLPFPISLPQDPTVS